MSAVTKVKSLLLEKIERGFAPAQRFVKLLNKLNVQTTVTEMGGAWKIILAYATNSLKEWIALSIFLAEEN